METEVKLMDTNLLEATRFLVLTMDKEELERSPLKRYLPRRRKVEGKKTGKLGLTTANSLAPGVNDMSQWEWSNVVIDSQVEKEIIAEALARMVGIFCETQTYTFGGEIYRQLKGLPIGPRLTCAIARIVMSKFDSMMTKRLSELRLKVNLLIRYMDDIRKLLQAIKSGTVYKDGKLGYCREKDILDRSKSDERITADLLLEIMNELLPGIQFTAEIGEEFPGEWGLPTLDTVMRVSEDDPTPH